MQSQYTQEEDEEDNADHCIDQTQIVQFSPLRGRMPVTILTQATSETSSSEIVGGN